MQTVAFHTLGCKLNFSETSTLARQFKDAGWCKADFPGPADVYVINTCSVTENADRECRQIVNRAMASNPDGKVIVVGCYAQLKPQEIADMQGVDLVLGANEKFNVLQYLDNLQKQEHGSVISCEIEDVKNYISSYSSDDRTRVFLKVQDGCDYSCTFCTIPQARGMSRSDTVKNVITQVEKIVASGAQEIVLTGVNLGDFGLSGENGSRTEKFIDLAKALENISGLMRVRISSIEPNLVTDEVIKHVSVSSKFVPHFHIPLQSGSDEMLKAMRRRYLRQLYVDRVTKIKSLMPNSAIGVDVIVGFPGETDELFNETVQFLKDLDISYLHVFTYSERANTPAVEMEGVVPVNIRKQRNKVLRNLSMKKQRAFYESQIGSQWPVLFEAEKQEGLMYGYSSNYI
ncbi:MAG TPA: tRNA (N(6)-L-threonylcarbamoyladenosine(37)-C(2))-methylthiotransferase MtaB, partial [Bacteroidia bacterium]|nr:tRNA (N(6)-L-threonylcarbamoyladenosine(37)-C(2))-methylthiotransferase MtaB [Bacteroidia bacterium]